MIGKFLCLIGQHPLHVVHRFDAGALVACPRCEREWGMHDGERAFVPWDGDFEAMYTSHGHHRDHCGSVNRFRGHARGSVCVESGGRSAFGQGADSPQAAGRVVTRATITQTAKAPDPSRPPRSRLQFLVIMEAKRS